MKLTQKSVASVPSVPRFLLISDPSGPPLQHACEWPSSVEIVPVSPEDFTRSVAQGGFDGVLLSTRLAQSKGLGLFESEAILDQLPDGVALLDQHGIVLRGNQKLREWFGENLVGRDFHEVMGNPRILSPDRSAVTASRETGELATSLMQTEDGYFRLNAVPLVAPYPTDELRLVVTVRDTTRQTLQRQKLQALREAGMELADLRPEEIFEMDVENRIELLKDNIIHYTKDLLNFDVVEIRLLDQTTNRLEPLLSVGINSEESKKPLYAEATGNGVTGFVVATGNSYLCEDATNDPIYLDGLIGAKSSLTVPLVYHDQVIGSFNVESPEINAFTESDLEFVELFARDIAVALNTLELLSAQQTNAAQQSVEAIHSAVAMPVDELLNDTVHVIESYIGHDKDVIKRLRKILKNARDIKQVIQKVGQSLAPAGAVPAGVQVDQRPNLIGRRILVIDADDQVRESAHNLLGRYGCIVETAHEGREAILMVRNCDPDANYDAIISDIRLPDIDGYELLLQLKKLMDDPPLILMTGFGYDPGHSIVKARRAGLRAGSVLFKPFRLDQLLEIVESVIQQVSGARTATE